MELCSVEDGGALSIQIVKVWHMRSAPRLLQLIISKAVEEEPKEELNSYFIDNFNSIN